MGRSAKPTKASARKIGKEEKAQRLAAESAIRGADREQDPVLNLMKGGDEKE